MDVIVGADYRHVDLGNHFPGVVGRRHWRLWDRLRPALMVEILGATIDMVASVPSA